MTKREIQKNKEDAYNRMQTKFMTAPEVTVDKLFAGTKLSDDKVVEVINDLTNLLSNIK
jgi:hypothetical protein